MDAKYKIIYFSAYTLCLIFPPLDIRRMLSPRNKRMAGLADICPSPCHRNNRFFWQQKGKKSGIPFPNANVPPTSIYNIVFQVVDFGG